MFFTIAGIHESVATQKKIPLWNQRRADLRESPFRATTISGASAKRTSMRSPIGGNAAHRRNPGRNQASCLNRPTNRSITLPPIG